MKANHIVAFRSGNISEFTYWAEHAAGLNATHVLVTEDLPKASWQLDRSRDPYPAWFIHQPGLLKIFPSGILKPFVDLDHAERVASLIEERCRILRRLGLKACYQTNEPQVLPEEFFRTYPELRGPRVDHPHRSRLPHFAPCTDRREILDLYSAAIRALLTRCPEVEVFFMMTTDSGSGFCWAPSLYPGNNGPSNCYGADPDARVVRFLTTLQEAGREAGCAASADLVEIPPRPWMVPTFQNPAALAARLPRGLAVNHREGPDGRRFTGTLGIEGLWWNAFYPVIGVPRPAAFLRKLSAGAQTPANWQVVSFNDRLNNELNFAVWRAFKSNVPAGAVERLSLLRDVAAASIGRDKANTLLELWLQIDEAESLLETLDFGPVLLMGCVLTRWINRPFVPFPEELPDEDLRTWKPFLLQAKSDAQAFNLADIQAMRMFEGWGSRLIVENVTGLVLRKINRAISLAGDIEDTSMAIRLRVLRCFIRCVSHAVAYQAQLDRIKQIETPPTDNPPLGARGSWERDDLQGIARREISNAIDLRELWINSTEPLIDIASSAEEETITQLGPDLPDQLARKIAIMDSAWGDYDRLFTPPNP